MAHEDHTGRPFGSFERFRVDVVLMRADSLNRELWIIRTLAGVIGLGGAAIGFLFRLPAVVLTFDLSGCTAPSPS